MLTHPLEVSFVLKISTWNSSFNFFIWIATNVETFVPVEKKKVI